MKFSDPCPIESAHTRLMDLHEHIHRAIENYFEPDEFRRCLNSAIQDSRNVTFLLQKQKAEFEDFDHFYEKWKNEVKGNKILKWAVDARNQVTKQSDLTKSSKMIATVFDPKRMLGKKTFEVRPESTTEKCIAIFLSINQNNVTSRELALRIERVWISDELPDIEVTDALIEVYRNLNRIIQIAHEAAGISECGLSDQKRQCVTSKIKADTHCFDKSRESRTINVSLSSGERLLFQSSIIERDDGQVPELLERYGKNTQERFDEDPFKHAYERLELMRVFIEKDGSTMPLMVVEGENGERKLFLIPMETGRPQGLIIAEALASLGAWPYNSVTFSGETWISNNQSKSEVFGIPEEAFLPSSTEFDPSTLGTNALDAISVIVFSKNKEPLVLLQPFANTIQGAVFGQLIESTGWQRVPASLRSIFQET